MRVFKTVLFTILLCVGFCACVNSIDPPSDDDSQDCTVNTAKYGTITGRYISNGAVPSQFLIKSEYEQINLNRTALPELGSTKNPVSYYAIATAIGETPVEGTVNADKTFSIPGIRFGVYWTIEVGIEVNGVRAYYDTTVPMLITENNCSMEAIMFLRPDSTGYGNIELDLAVDSETSINKLVITLDDETQRNRWNAACEADSEKMISTSQIKLSNLAAGIYDITMTFYYANPLNTNESLNFPAFTSVQTINVIRGMTTDTWLNEGSNTTLISLGADNKYHYQLTAALVSSYVDSCIYVGANSASNSIGVNPADSNEGRAYSPLAHVSEAITRIKNTGIARDYTIFVSGEIDDTVTINVPSTAASSLTIQGLNTNTGSDYNDIISGSSNTQSTITISSCGAPVTFKNIKIKTAGTDYCNIQQGGGISISNSTVILGNGAWVGHCLTRTGGYTSAAGIYFSGGSLTLKPGSVVSYNSATSTVSSFSTYGGGIYCESGNFNMEGGEIHHNSALNGGGIYSKINLFINGNSNIYNNTAVSDSGEAEEVGGAICMNNVNNGRVYIGYKNTTDKKTMTGKIYNNTAGKYGGAIHGNVTMDSGTIENNTGGLGAGAINGYLSISGSSYIPYGGVAKNNDIQTTAISVAGHLYPPQSCLNNASYPGIIAVCSPGSGIRGAYLITADTTSCPGLTLTTYKNNFAINDPDWYLQIDSAGTGLRLNSPIYVAGANKQVCTANGSSSGPGTKASPFDSLNSVFASTILNSTTFDYDIIVDGTITGPQTIPNTVQAQSITIKGANSFTSNTDRKDIITTGTGTALAIQLINSGTAASVIIKNLKITGGAQGSGGAGIHMGSNRVLTLGDDVLVQGNNGAGVYLSSTSTLKVKGNVVVSGNTQHGTSTPCNVYLPAGKTIEVIGPLVNSTDSTKKANIGVSIATAPAVGTPTAITTGYSTNGNSGVAPYNYFSGDSTAVVSTTSGEAGLAFSGGNISVSPLFETITIGIDKTIGSCGAQSAFTFNATDASGTVIPAGTGTGKINYSSYVVTYHGEDLTASTHYTTGTSSVILGTSLPVGNYTIYVTGDYNGQSYSAEFSVQLIQSGTISTLTASPTSGTYTLKTTEDFAKLIQWSNESSMNAGVTYTMEEDIVLTNWNVSSNATFKGTLDGNGHTITIGSLSSGTSYLLGKETYSATIKNLTVEGNVNGRYQGFANRFQSSSVMENVVSKVNVNYTGSGACSGLFYDCGNNCTIINCRNEGSIYAPNANKVGGIYSSDSASGVKIIGCVNTGNITGNTNVGGICGVTWSCVRDCRNEGTITGKNSVGGIAGMNYVPDSYTQGVINCINTGSVITSQTDGAVGGICGVLGCSNNASSTYNNGVLLNSVNLGTVQTDSVTSDYKGGLVGRIVEGCKVDYYQNNYYIQNGSLAGAGNSSDTSGVCNKFTNSGSSCNVASAITVGDYTGTDIVQLLNAWVNSNTLNFPVLSTYPLKTWKYGSGGNIEFDE